MIKKAITAVALLTAVATNVQAKEINLECTYTGVEGGQKTSNIVLNTDLGTATNSFGQGMLIAKPDVYEFKVNVLGQTMYTTIDRNTLAYENAWAHTVKGTCKVVEAPKTKI